MFTPRTAPFRCRQSGFGSGYLRRACALLALLPAAVPLAAVSADAPSAALVQAGATAAQTALLLTCCGAGVSKSGCEEAAAIAAAWSSTAQPRRDSLTVTRKTSVLPLAVLIDTLCSRRRTLENTLFVRAPTLKTRCFSGTLHPEVAAKLAAKAAHISAAAAALDSAACVHTRDPLLRTTSSVSRAAAALLRHLAPKPPAGAPPPLPRSVNVAQVVFLQQRDMITKHR